MSKFFNVQKLLTKAIKSIPRSKKVSPDIKSVPPTKLSIKKSLEKTRGAEYTKRARKLREANEEVETGKKLMKKGQKTRKKMKDTGTAFQFKHSKSYHTVDIGDKEKYKIKDGISKGSK